MNFRADRRGFLKSFTAFSALSASPALARTSWSIMGADRGSLRIAFFTDVHASTGGRISRALAKAAASINKERVDLVLGGGDLIDGGFNSTRAQAAAEWDTYMGFHQSISGEVHSAIGNRDLVGVAPADGSVAESDLKVDFRERLGLTQTTYAIDAVGYHIIVLDCLQITENALHYQGRVSTEQLEWLAEDLSGVPSEMPVILLLHMPLATAFFGISKGSIVPSRPDRVVVNNREVLSVFENHNLVLVLQGHTHVAEMIHWRGITFLTGGAISGNWWRGAYHGTQEGFSVLTLNHDNIIWDYIDYGWDAAG